PSVRIGLRAMRRIAERLVAEVGVACLPMLAQGGTGGRRRVVPGRLIAVVVRLVLLPDSGEVLLKADGGWIASKLLVAARALTSVPSTAKTSAKTPALPHRWRVLTNVVRSGTGS